MSCHLIARLRFQVYCLVANRVNLQASDHLTNVFLQSMSTDLTGFTLITRYFP